MKWPWSKKPIEFDERLLRESKAEKKRAERQYGRAEELLREAKKLGEESERIRAENHFAEAYFVPKWRAPWHRH